MSVTPTTANKEILVRFRGIQKSYDGETLIVKDLNLDIEKGEFLTLLGPSGSGKTTSLMMLAGFEMPTAGEIQLGGKSINNLPPHKRNIGMVFQNYALFPHMTVAENLAFPLSVRGINKAERQRRVHRALEMVQLGSFGGRYPNQLSGGQQQRVALARALVFEPELVLMDEPLGALDKQLREHMQMEIKHLHQSLGVTVVYVTHDQSELYEAPHNAFVAQFIGENNRLSGTLQSLGNGECSVKLEGGEQLKALAVKVGQVGEPVSLSIRPERIRLGAASTACTNQVQGKIEEFIYLGDHVRIRMQVCGSHDFIVKQPIAELDPALAPGHQVSLGWQAEHIRALNPIL